MAYVDYLRVMISYDKLNDQTLHKDIMRLSNLRTTMEIIEENESLEDVSYDQLEEARADLTMYDNEVHTVVMYNSDSKEIGIKVVKSVDLDSLYQDLDELSREERIQVKKEVFDLLFLENKTEDLSYIRIFLNSTLNKSFSGFYSFDIFTKFELDTESEKGVECKLEN